MGLFVVLSLWGAVVGVGCVPSAVFAQDRPPGQQALFDAQARIKGLPLEQAVKAYEQVIAQFPGTVYAGQALLNIGSLYLENKLPEQALTNAEQALQEYGDTYLAGAAIRRKFVTLAFALKRPREALEFLDEVLDQYTKQLTATDRAWLPVHRYDCFRAMGDKEAALNALQDGLLDYPQTLDTSEFMKRYIPALREAGKRPEALSAAKGAYACCRFKEEDIGLAARQVVDTLTSVGDVVKANAFIAAQEDATAANPLADVPWPVITDADKEKLLAGTLGDVNVQASVHLYLGEYDEALALATQRLAAVKDTASIQACVDSLARCFKAKDLSLVRGNAFLTYVQTGEGDNPLLTF